MSTAATQTQTATFALGCFWGAEHLLQKHYGPSSENKGILTTTVGYTGGNTKKNANPGENDETAATGAGTAEHAEAVKIEFNPTAVSYDELVEFFYRIHDPTTLNRQGDEVGAEYRSSIFTHSDEQNSIAQRVTEEVQAKHFTPKDQKIVTEILPAGEWFDAEEYHQHYSVKNPNYVCPAHRLFW